MMTYVSQPQFYSGSVAFLHFELLWSLRPRTAMPRHQVTTKRAPHQVRRTGGRWIRGSRSLRNCHWNIGSRDGALVNWTVVATLDTGMRLVARNEQEGMRVAVGERGQTCDLAPIVYECCFVQDQVRVTEKNV